MYPVLLLFLFLPERALSTTPKCGGRYTAARGVLSTPNFPSKFPTPINCQWIIDAQNRVHNSSIVVYLTQLYVFEGLSFKEYQFYIDNYPELPGEEIYRVSEDSVNVVTFVQCWSDYLVITLNLSSVEGAHLRVLDRLLDVYGFNITYEITNRPPREDGCTMQKCGFTGNCYDHYTHFACDCFPGYSGKRCSEGEKSKCYSNGEPKCKNGATCTHAGDSHVVCECTPGFGGTYCDVPIAKPSKNKGCEECLISCPYDGSAENVCKCSKTQSVFSANDSIGFSSTVVVANMSTSMSDAEMKTYLGKYMTELLRANSTTVGDVHIPYLKSQPEGIEMTFRFYGLKKDDRRIRSTINKWEKVGAIGNVTLVEKDIILTTDPYLYLKNVSINKNRVIRVNEDFLLSCEARGSRDMIFRWFKNGMVVNKDPNVSHKWIKLIEEEGSKDQYTALLSIQKATELDEGTFTCQVEDYGIQQCRSKTVVLRHAPKIELLPLSLTVNKGQPFNIKCLNVPKHNDRHVYIWRKDNILLQKKTEFEHYEILYPGGSILQVSGLNKSATYSCTVQVENVSSETSIVVNVIDRSVITPCPAEDMEDFTWPETAPGYEYKHKCPKNYSGVSSRSCIMLENVKPQWQLPDYSNCTALELLTPKMNFQILSQGYENTTPFAVIASIARYTNNRTLLRGEGYVILKLLQEICAFNSVFQHSPTRKVTKIVLEVVDELLSQLQSLNKEQHVLLLQKLIHYQLSALGGRPFHQSLRNLDAQVVLEAGHLDNLFVDRPATLSRVAYRNLHNFLSKSIVRLNDDRDIDYKIVSDIVRVWRTPADVAKSYFYEASFAHRKLDDVLAWDVRCALAEFAGSNYVWDTNVCYSKSLNDTTTLCNCSKQGTMALLLVKEPKKVNQDSNPPRDMVILIGCSICLLVSSICAAFLLLNWVYHRSSFTFLKMQCCISVSGTMILFIVAHCNNLPKNVFLYVVSFLQVFFYMGMSSQLSTLLIVYSELVEIQNKDSLKQTVVGIITGAPMIVVFGNHLAHRTMDIHLTCWWILKHTLSFNVFTSCTIIILILFVVLYCLVVKMLRNDKTMATKFLTNRSRLVRNTCVVFAFVVSLAAVSVAYVNCLEEVAWHYVFSATSALTGISTSICLTYKTQFPIKRHLMEKFGSTANSSPQKSSHCEDESDEVDLQLRGSPKSDLTPSIEQYNSSPTQFNLVSKSNSLSSPDILGAKVFVELDLVASSLQGGRSASYDRLSRAEQPLLVTTTCSDKKLCKNDESEAVMNSISNDLNYLLNGHVELTASLK